MVRVSLNQLTRHELGLYICKLILALGSTGVIVGALNPDGPIDLAGDWGRERSPTEIHQLKLDQRREIMARELTPIGRFTLSYIGSQFTEEDNYINYHGITDNNGFLGKVHSAIRVGSLDEVYLTAAENCLAGTTYDPTPSELRGRTKGDISAIAGINIHLDEEGQQHTVISPAVADGDNLDFITDEEGFLQPVDDATKNVLEAYGCDDNLNN